MPAKKRTRKGIPKPTNTKRKKKKPAVKVHALPGCAICLEDIHETNVPSGHEKTTLNGCVHLFHMDCIEKWSKVENTCPQCKARFTKLTQTTPSGISTRRSRKKRRTVDVCPRDQPNAEQYSVREYGLISSDDDDGYDPDRMFYHLVARLARATHSHSVGSIRFLGGEDSDDDIPIVDLAVDDPFDSGNSDNDIANNTPAMMPSDQQMVYRPPPSRASLSSPIVSFSPALRGPPAASSPTSNRITLPISWRAFLQPEPGASSPSSGAPSPSNGASSSSSVASSSSSGASSSSSGSSSSSSGSSSSSNRTFIRWSPQARPRRPLPRSRGRTVQTQRVNRPGPARRSAPFRRRPVTPAQPARGVVRQARVVPPLSMTLRQRTARRGPRARRTSVGATSRSATRSAPQRPAPQQSAPQRPAPQRPAPQGSASQRSTAVTRSQSTIASRTRSKHSLVDTKTNELCQNEHC